MAKGNHHPNMSGLIHLKKGDPRSKAIARKGGLVRSDRKKIAAKLRGLNMRGKTDKECKEMYDMLMDEDMTDIVILDKILKLFKESESISDFTGSKDVLGLMIKWRKERFGKTFKVESTIKVDWSNDVDRILTGCNVIDVASVIVNDDKDEEEEDKEDEGCRNED